VRGQEMRRAKVPRRWTSQEVKMLKTMAACARSGYCEEVKRTASSAIRGSNLRDSGSNAEVLDVTADRAQRQPVRSILSA
jgi:hypothetical protein